MKLKTGKQQRKSVKSIGWFFEKIYKIGKHLAWQTNKKEKRHKL